MKHILISIIVVNFVLIQVWNSVLAQDSQKGGTSSASAVGKKTKTSIPSMVSERIGGLFFAPIIVSIFAISNSLPQTKYGFIDTKGKLVFSAGFACELDESFADGVVAIDGGTVYWNKCGRRAFKTRFQSGTRFSEGLACVKNSGKFGYIDNQGNLLISPQYDEAKSFHEGLAAVKLNGRWGFINRRGEICIKPEFDYCLPFSNNRAAVLVGNKVGYIDSSGQMSVPPQFDYVWSFSQQRAIVGIIEGPKKLQHESCIDENGQVVFDLTILQSGYSTPRGMGPEMVDNDNTFLSAAISKHGYRGTQDGYHKLFSEGLLCVYLGRKFGYVDRAGSIVIAPKFETATQFSEGLAVVVSDGRAGYINHSGESKIPCSFERAEPFSEGLAAAFVDGKYGYIDKSGLFVIKPRFEACPRPFRESLALVGCPRDSF